MLPVPIAGAHTVQTVAPAPVAEVAAGRRRSDRFLLFVAGRLCHEPLQRIFGERHHRLSSSAIASLPSGSSSFSYSVSSSYSP